MFKKTAVSILLSAVMLISCLVIPATTVAAVTDSTEAVAADNATAYNLASDVQMVIFYMHLTGALPMCPGI